MKCPASLLFPFCIALSFCAYGPACHGQGAPQKPIARFGVRPLQGGDLSKIQAQSDAGTGLTVWTYKNINSTRKGSQGQKFSGVMVGSDPRTSRGTTSITMQLIPLIITIDGVKFDPTVPDNNCAGGNVPYTLLQQSPMVLPTNFTMNGVNIGNAQYNDAFQRANFWSLVQKNGGDYHTALNVAPLSPLVVDAGKNGTILSPTTPCGDPFGAVNEIWLIYYIADTAIPMLKSQGVGPTTFPVFMLYNIAMYTGTPEDCCTLGFHDAFGSPVQTFAPFMFDTTGYFGQGYENTEVMSHEVAEWMDDPLGTNPTPEWGHVGQQQGCQNNLEVGDPLSGTDFPSVTMPNGYTYRLQELAFASWFFGPPSIGAGGKFSDNGTFTSAQGACEGESVLYSFGAVPDGEAPFSGLVLDKKGDLFGTTLQGGAYGSGSVFELIPGSEGWAERVLHSFTGGADGRYPAAGLVQDAQGNLYGTASEGGSSANCCGVVFKLDTTDKETVLYTFAGGADGGNPAGGLILDAKGNLYGTAEYGGGCSQNNYGCGVVFEVDTSGKETVLHTFTGSPDGTYPFAGLIRDSGGNLYGTTTQGGISDYGTVFKVDTSAKETVLYSFMGGADGATPYASLIMDSPGNLYGTTGQGGDANCDPQNYGCGTVFKVDTTGKETLLHIFTGTPDGSDPLAPLVQDATGNFYGTTAGGGSVVGYGYGVVFKLDTTGKETVLYTFTGSPDGAEPFAGLILDPAGNLYGTTAAGGAFNSGTVFRYTP